MVPSDDIKIIYKSGSKYLAMLIYDYRKNPVCLTNLTCVSENINGGM